jgi:hypothetical protein
MSKRSREGSEKAEGYSTRIGKPKKKPKIKESEREANRYLL